MTILISCAAGILCLFFLWLAYIDYDIRQDKKRVDAAQMKVDRLEWAYRLKYGHDVPGFGYDPSIRLFPRDHLSCSMSMSLTMPTCLIGPFMEDIPMSLAVDFEKVFGEHPDPQADNFSVQIFRLIPKADRENMEKLRQVYPEHVKMYEDWMKAF